VSTERIGGLCNLCGKTNLEHAGGQCPDPIVGHKTFADGLHGYRHEPLRQSEAEAIIAASDMAKEKRASDMPTEEDAAAAMWSAYQRLKELGWRETCYGPTNEVVRLIEPGSSGIHEGSRWKPWPEKTWWIDGDWPSNPCLFKPKSAASIAEAAQAKGGE